MLGPAIADLIEGMAPVNRRPDGGIDIPAQAQTALLMDFGVGVGQVLFQPRP